MKNKEKLEIQAALKELREEGKEILLLPYHVKDLMIMKFSKNPFLVDRLIPESGITIISGQPGCGKSWVALHILQCIASKKYVFGKFKTKKANALLVDGETGFAEIQRRMKLMKFRSDRQIYISSEDDINLNTKKDLSRIIDFIKRENIGFVIFDPFVALHDGDENMVKDMQKVMNAVKKITYEGVAVLIIHHHKKNEEGGSPSKQIRGSSAIHGAIDSHIEIKGEDNELGVIQVGQYKARRNKAEKPFIVKIEEENGLTFKFVEYIQRPLNGTQEIKELILVILNQEIGKDLKTIRLEVSQNIKIGVGENKIRSALKELEIAGKIKATRTGHNTFVYCKT